MTMTEGDLLAALKELLETSQLITSGENPSAEALERHQKAIEWSKRVIARVEHGK